MPWSGKVEERTVTGSSLVERTIFYKVGHHGSHNATLRHNGLERMKNLRFAVIPVDRKMAIKKRWGRMPLPALLEALEAKAQAGVYRTDEDAESTEEVTVNELYVEVAL
jgi:hypothetical protein